MSLHKGDIWMKTDTQGEHQVKPGDLLPEAMALTEAKGTA